MAVTSIVKGQGNVYGTNCMAHGFKTDPTSSKAKTDLRKQGVKSELERTFKLGLNQMQRGLFEKAIETQREFNDLLGIAETTDPELYRAYRALMSGDISRSNVDINA